MVARSITKRLLGIALIAVGALFVLAYDIICGNLSFIPFICQSSGIGFGLGSMLIIVGFLLMF